MRRRPIKPALGVLAALLLAGCDVLFPVASVPVPPARPNDLVLPAPEDPRLAAPSPQSRALSNYYRRVESTLLSQGLLRTDGGGVDTPYNSRILQENFERIAFYDEYARGAGLTVASTTPGRLKRWTRPIRFTVEHGDWASEAVKSADRSEVAAYVARLRRITGHPMSMNDNAPNFHVLYANADDMPSVGQRVREIVPNVNPEALSIFDDLSREIQCLVIAFSSDAGGYEYARAIAIIRAEHPPLMRRSCVHEEIAQGLGLANDSPRARPSIFNDDDEFALLTSHDEKLLDLLYDRAFRPGMTLEQARPILRQKTLSLMGGES